MLFLVDMACALVLVVLSTLIHFYTLRACNRALMHMRAANLRAGALVAVLVAFTSHLAQIALFAGAYELLIVAGYGQLSGLLPAMPHTAPFTLAYFSIETYTSLGFGDLLPGGALRLVAGIEALVGLLMIGWTASFTYLEMSRHWDGPAPQHGR